MNIDIPTVSPHGDPVETIGIWMSGGVDSSLCCYLVCKSIKEQGLNIRVQPLTVRRPKPGNPLHAVPVSRKIKELLDFDLMNPHIVYYPKIDTEEERDIANGPFFIEQNHRNFGSGKIQILFSGLTQNPPQSVQLTFKDGISKEEPIRGEAVERKYEHYGIGGSGKYHWQIDPLRNYNKRDLALVYREEGIMDSLYPLTRSCEHVQWKEDGTPDHPVDGHCEICWWCEERYWGFGRYE